MSDHDYKVLLDAKEIVRNLRDERGVRKEALDAHAVMVLLIAKLEQYEHERGELVAPF